MTKKRKFSAYIATLIVTAILCANGSVTGEDFVRVIQVATTVFIIGNGAEHYFETKKDPAA